MTKIIGIKELQQKTKIIRQEVEKGTHFIVIYRSRPIFEINPIPDGFEFAESMKNTGIYTDEFINKMQEAEKNVKNGETTTYSTEDFLNSLK